MPNSKFTGMFFNTISRPHPDAEYWLKKLLREANGLNFDIFCRFVPGQMSIRFALGCASHSGEHFANRRYQIGLFLEELQGNYPPHEFHVDLRLYYKKMLRLGFSKCIPPEESSIFFLEPTSDDFGAPCLAYCTRNGDADYFYCALEYGDGKIFLLPSNEEVGYINASIRRDQEGWGEDDLF